jgi:hypothetical protein
MKAIVEKKNNGIHDYYHLIFEDAETKDFPFMEALMLIVEECNKQEAEKA